MMMMMSEIKKNRAKTCFATGIRTKFFELILIVN